MLNIGKEQSDELEVSDRKYGEEREQRKELFLNSLVCMLLSLRSIPLPHLNFLEYLSSLDEYIDLLSGKFPLPRLRRSKRARPFSRNVTEVEVVVLRLLPLLCIINRGQCWIWRGNSILYCIG